MYTVSQPFHDVDTNESYLGEDSLLLEGNEFSGRHIYATASASNNRFNQYTGKLKKTRSIHCKTG